MRKLLLLVMGTLLAFPAFAGVVDFTITTNLANESPVCTATLTSDCVLGTRLYYVKGSTQVNIATTPFAANATGINVQSLPGQVVRSYAKGMVFSAVIQGKDINGVLIESNPTSAAPVDLKPGAAVSVTAVVP